MKRLYTPLIILCSLLNYGALASDDERAAFELSFDFADGLDLWEVDWSDYHPSMRESLDLESDLRDLPTEVGLAKKGWFLSFRNASDDLFTYLRFRVAEGIDPDSKYQASFTLSFASKEQSGCFGAGGAPGEGVVVKMGMSAIKPMTLQESRDPFFYYMNIDKGNQSREGVDASNAGDLANGTPCGSEAPKFKLLTIDHVHPGIVSPQSNGMLWLVIGFDSGYEGVTDLYLVDLSVRLESMDATK